MKLTDLLKVLAPDQSFKVVSPSGHCHGVIYKKLNFEGQNLTNYKMQQLDAEVSVVHTSDDLNDVIFIWLKREIYNNG